MHRRRTLKAAFDAEPGPAVPVSDLNDRIRQLGSACTPDALVREVATGRDGLRTLAPADAVLREVVGSCPPSSRPLGADRVVVEDVDRGLRPTPADAVRVLARRLDPRDRPGRARWMRMLHALPPAWSGQTPGVGDACRNSPVRHSPSSSISRSPNPSSRTADSSRDH